MKIKNATPIENAKACPTGSGTNFGYSVEARVNYAEPKNICGMIFDNRWRQVPWSESPGMNGVPRPAFRGPELTLPLLLSRAEAEALRWLTICAADASDICGSLCLETRIVQHRVEYSYSATPVAYLDAFDGRADLPADMLPPLSPPETDGGQDGQ